jgi:hypothetical protein
MKLIIFTVKSGSLIKIDDSLKFISKFLKDQGFTEKERLELFDKKKVKKDGQIWALEN